ncbi:hypothetical protein CROQUDRAFT_543038 [Cronartium quercuum f. sp. fusiforme G11]|uniref:Uncharacterized protein n=1 Tax=Cronartium quercuum f. sp. fusiforme G11 TaxID=708437 RepID=A0A9P6TH56_9BASI|nr:hypothetical protein CROQUDRAFT_543038 [Cronartium quercuum f. sp. fusiforme G11]
MSDQDPKGKAPKVREIFAEDYDEEVLDYESGLRRQALRLEREKNQISGSRNDVVIIHIKPTHPTKPETSTSAFPNTECKRSGVSSITRGLKRMISKRSKTRPSVASKDSIPSPTQSQDEADALILESDISILMETNPAILGKAVKAAKRVKLARKRLGILATDKVCAKLKEEFSDAPTSPMKRQGFVGDEEVSVALREGFRLEPSPPESFKESEESLDSLHSQKSTVSEQQDYIIQPDSPIDPMM